MLGLHLPTTGHHNGGGCTETSVKTALAAGLGSSLFLFRGLDRLSPRILTEASLQPPSSSSTSSSPKTSPVSGPASPTSSFRTGGRTNSSGSMGGVASRSKAHRPQYHLTVQCSECTRIGKACPYTGDINYGDRNRMAFEDEHYHGSRPTERIFEFHVCSWNPAPMRVIEKFMRRGDSGAPKEPFRVNDLFEGLREAGAEPVWVNGGW